MTKKPITDALTTLLWQAYETALPDTPRRMAVVIVERLKQLGYLEGEE
jgi:DNA-directed RNA polymerase specialized sigma54-like protein